MHDDGCLAWQLQIDCGATGEICVGFGGSVSCEAPTLCGNGRVDPGEECDDGADPDNDDGCTETCLYSCHADMDCGDGHVCNGTEFCHPLTHTCSPGTAYEDGFVCQSDPRAICLEGECRYSLCGDGFVDAGGGEQCEPPSVGRCNESCQIICIADPDCPDDRDPCSGDEYCNTTSGVCEGRNPMNEGDVCREDPRRICIDNTCQESSCGDEYVDTGAVPPEECDDGNTDGGDGCEADCTYTCRNDSECVDAEPCNGDETCDIAMHICRVGTNAGSGTACDDGLFCTEGDQCNGSGSCEAGTVDPCDDSRTCTVNETCSEGTGTYECDFDIAANSCLIGGICRTNGEDDPSNECQECVSATAQMDWTGKPNGTMCQITGVCCDGLCQGTCP